MRSKDVKLKKLDKKFEAISNEMNLLSHKSKKYKKLKKKWLFMVNYQELNPYNVNNNRLNKLF